MHFPGNDNFKTVSPKTYHQRFDAVQTQDSNKSHDSQDHHTSRGCSRGPFPTVIISPFNPTSMQVNEISHFPNKMSTFQPPYESMSSANPIHQLPALSRYGFPNSFAKASPGATGSYDVESPVYRSQDAVSRISTTPQLSHSYVSTPDSIISKLQYARNGSRGSISPNASPVVTGGLQTQREMAHYIRPMTNGCDGFDEERISAEHLSEAPQRDDLAWLNSQDWTNGESLAGTYSMGQLKYEQEEQDNTGTPSEQEPLSIYGNPPPHAMVSPQTIQYAVSNGHRDTLFTQDLATISPPFDNFPPNSLGLTHPHLFSQLEPTTEGYRLNDNSHEFDFNSPLQQAGHFNAYRPVPQPLRSNDNIHPPLAPRGQASHSTHIRGRHGDRDKIAEENRQLLTFRDVEKMSFKEIAGLGIFGVTESTLRGRYRALTKPKEQRLRKPPWNIRDEKALIEGVRLLTPHSAQRGRSNPDLNKVPWKKVAEWMVRERGCYLFGNATVKKQYKEIAKRAARKQREAEPGY